MKIASTNPSKNYEVIEEVEFSTPEEVKAKVDSAHLAKQVWQDLDIATTTDAKTLAGCGEPS